MLFPTHLLLLAKSTHWARVILAKWILTLEAFPTGPFACNSVLQSLFLELHHASRCSNATPSNNGNLWRILFWGSLYVLSPFLLSCPLSVPLLLSLQAQMSLCSPCPPPSSKVPLMQRSPISHLHLSVNLLVGQLFQKCLNFKPCAWL